MAAGTFDATGSLEHEISEVLGRVAYGGRVVYGDGDDYTLMDMYRYTAANGAQTMPGALYGLSYDGKTIGYDYSTPYDEAMGADHADWGPDITGDSFGDAAPGVAGQGPAEGWREPEVDDEGVLIGSNGKAALPMASRLIFEIQTLPAYWIPARAAGQTLSNATALAKRTPTMSSRRHTTCASPTTRHESI